MGQIADFQVTAWGQLEPSRTTANRARRLCHVAVPSINTTSGWRVAFKYRGHQPPFAYGNVLFRGRSPL